MASTAIQEVKDASWEQEVLKSTQPVLVDFWATWCAPCRALAPVVEEVARAYQGRVKVLKMDVDSNPATPPRYGIRGIPTLLLFKDGRVRETLVGGNSTLESIGKKLDPVLAEAAVHSH